MLKRLSQWLKNISKSRDKNERCFMIDDKIIEEVVQVVQDGHINFLIGSGLNVPYLNTLGNIETLLSELEQKELERDKKRYLEASIKKKFFDDVVLKNHALLHGDTTSKKVLSNYENFIGIWIAIFLKRKSSLLGKQINLFTSNYDIFLEKAIETSNVDFNDGFNGRLNPIFSTSNFNKIFYKKSLQYDNRSELPYFNLLKMHGSLTWDLNITNNIIEFSDLEMIKEIGEKSSKISTACNIESGIKTIDELLTIIDSPIEFTTEMGTFLDAYNKLAIVNPTKAKFRETLLDKNYYSLLRIFSNELEKENAVLFILGFSMADEHIAEIIIRALDSNPTLMIYIVAYDQKSKKSIAKNIDRADLEYKRLKYISPNANMKKTNQKYNLENINKLIFTSILNKIKN